jgi:hypothetical protein
LHRHRALNDLSIGCWSIRVVKLSLCHGICQHAIASQAVCVCASVVRSGKLRHGHGFKSKSRSTPALMGSLIGSLVGSLVGSLALGSFALGSLALVALALGSLALGPSDHFFAGLLLDKCVVLLGLCLTGSNYTAARHDGNRCRHGGVARVRSWDNPLGGRIWIGGQWWCHGGCDMQYNYIF